MDHCLLNATKATLIPIEVRAISQVSNIFREEEIGYSKVSDIIEVA